MKPQEQIIQEYAMGFITPGELVSQLKPHYKGLNPLQIMNTVKTILK